MKRSKLLSLLLVLGMLMTLLPTISLAAEYDESDYAATVYVDGVNGANTVENDGSTSPLPRARRFPSALLPRCCFCHQRRLRQHYRHGGRERSGY